MHLPVFVILDKRILRYNHGLSKIEILKEQTWETILHEGKWPNGFGLYKNELYLFDAFNSLKCNIITKFTKPIIMNEVFEQCHYLKNKFYFFNQNECIGFFDPQNDSFTFKKIII